jgi:hypothetical protein
MSQKSFRAKNMRGETSLMFAIVVVGIGAVVIERLTSLLSASSRTYSGIEGDFNVLARMVKERIDCGQTIKNSTDLSAGTCSEDANKSFSIVLTEVTDPLASKIGKFELRGRCANKAVIVDTKVVQLAGVSSTPWRKIISSADNLCLAQMNPSLPCPTGTKLLGTVLGSPLCGKLDKAEEEPPAETPKNTNTTLPEGVSFSYSGYCFGNLESDPITGVAYSYHLERYTNGTIKYPNTWRKSATEPNVSEYRDDFVCMTKELQKPTCPSNTKLSAIFEDRFGNINDFRWNAVCVKK